MQKKELSQYRKQQMIAYNRANKETIREYSNNYKTDKRNQNPLYRLDANLRSSINSAMRLGGYREGSRVHILLGCDYDTYIAHIESTLLQGMTWENYGKGYDSWSLDHTIPTSTSQDVDELLKRFHYTNTKAMWSVENTRKGNK